MTKGQRAALGLAILQTVIDISDEKGYSPEGKDALTEYFNTLDPIDALHSIEAVDNMCKLAAASLTNRALRQLLEGMPK